MVRRLCGTVATGQGLIGANGSGLLVRKVVRFARCNVLLPFFAVRLPDWRNSPPEFTVLSTLLVLARLRAPDSRRPLRVSGLV